MTKNNYTHFLKSIRLTLNSSTNNTSKKLPYINNAKYKYYALNNMKIYTNKSRYNDRNFNKIQKRKLARMPFWIHHTYSTRYLNDNVSRITHQRLYDDQYLWYSNSIEDKYLYKMGISNDFIRQYGKINYYSIDIEKNTTVFKNDVLGIIENDKTIYEIKCLFDIGIITDIQENIEDNINTTPEDVDSWIIKITDISESCIYEKPYEYTFPTYNNNYIL